MWWWVLFLCKLNSPGKESNDIHCRSLLLDSQLVLHGSDSQTYLAAPEWLTFSVGSIKVWTSGIHAGWSRASPVLIDLFLLGDCSLFLKKYIYVFILVDLFVWSYFILIHMRCVLCLLLFWVGFLKVLWIFVLVPVFIPAYWVVKCWLFLCVCHSA